MCSSINPTASSRASGLAMPLPAISGAEPCTASNYRGVRSDICAGSHTKAAYQSGELIRQGIAEQVGGDDDVELPGVHDKLHRRCIDDASDADISFRELPGSLPSDELAPRPWRGRN